MNFPPKHKTKMVFCSSALKSSSLNAGKTLPKCRPQYNRYSPVPPITRIFIFYLLYVFIN